MTKIDVSQLTVSFREAASLVENFIQAQEPLMIWGPPGIGKSDLIKDVGAKMNREVIDIRLSLYGSEDIKGYPFIDEQTGKMKFSISNEFPDDPNSNAILFFDEINAAMPSTQLCMYQLILNRKIGEYVLPKGVSIVAAGNRESDRAGLSEMPKPLQNRFAHIEMNPDFEDWLLWAVHNNVNPDVIGFLSNFKEKLFQFDPSKSSRAFATPRSWVKASTMLNLVPNADKETRFNLVASCVGSPNAHEVEQFHKLMAKLPNIDSILDGTAPKIEKEHGIGLQYAIIMTLLYRINKIKTDLEKGGAIKVDSPEELKLYEKINNFFKFMNDNSDVIGPEFSSMVISSLTKTYGIKVQLKLLPELMKLLKGNQKFFKDVFEEMKK